MAQTNINIRIDANRKKEFEEFCEAVGLTMTAAFNIFIQRTLLETIEFPLILERKCRMRKPKKPLKKFNE